MTSIVDYLKSQGKDSSFASRTKLAEQYGIQGYAGSADQNLSLLSMLQKGAAPTGPVAPTPTAPVTPEDAYKVQAKSAGAAGLSLNDTASLFGATPEEQKARKDELSKTFGYGSFDEFAKDAFTKPSKTTEQFYRDAYSAAGLDKLQADITAKKTALNQAIGAINDNPWLSEASRTGRARRLQELANLDISTWQETYDLGRDRVRELVAANAADIAADEKRREAQFNYLLKAAEEAAAQQGTQRLNTYLSDYLAGRQSTQEPKTVSLGEGQSLYQWNPATNSFDLLASKPKSYAPSEMTSGLTSKQVTVFNGIVDKYNRSPLIQAADRTAILKSSIEAIRQNPNDAASQLNLSYGYIQALDTYQSAVREGELGNLNSIDSKIGTLANSIQRIQNGQIVRPEVAKQIADAAERIINAIDAAAKAKADSFAAQAKVSGIEGAWADYTSAFTPGYDRASRAAGVDAELESDIRSAPAGKTREQIIAELKTVYHELTEEQIASKVYTLIPDKR